MSDIALDRGLFLPDPFTDWYRERSFQIAFAASVLVHALLIAFVPGLRSVQIETPQVLNVEIVIPEEQRPIVREQAPLPEPQPEIVRQPEFAPPVPEVQPIERQVTPPEPKVEPVRQPEPEAVVPVQRAELALPVQREAPRPEPITLPRPDPLPEQRIEIPVEPRPVPQVQPLVAPPPVARVEPRPEPQLQPRIEPQPELLPQPIAELVPPVQPAPRLVAPVVAQPKLAEPVIAPPPVAALVPLAPPASTSKLAVEVDPIVVDAYKKMITAEIKQYKDYPLVAMRRKWEGTTVVALKLSADGGVSEVAVAESSGKDVLDKAALKMIQRALPLPKPPQVLHGRTIKVPILFKLEG